MLNIALKGQRVKACEIKSVGSVTVVYSRENIYSACVYVLLSLYLRSFHVGGEILFSQLSFHHREQVWPMYFYFFGTLKLICRVLIILLYKSQSGPSSRPCAKLS